jgi:hypothetical protein
MLPFTEANPTWFAEIFLEPAAARWSAAALENVGGSSFFEAAPGPWSPGPGAGQTRALT